MYQDIFWLLLSQLMPFLCALAQLVAIQEPVEIALKNSFFISAPLLPGSTFFRRKSLIQAFECTFSDYVKM